MPPSLIPLSICLPVSPVSVQFFFPFYLDRKTPEVFLVGNSRSGMLLREQAVRVESRFSGSGLTPCSTIPSRGSVSESESCQDSQLVLRNSRLFLLSRILKFGLYTTPSVCSILLCFFSCITPCF